MLHLVGAPSPRILGERSHFSVQRNGLRFRAGGSCLLSGSELGVIAMKTGVINFFPI